MTQPGADQPASSRGEFFTPQVSGAALAHGFYRDVVEPLFKSEFPRLRYAAARLGSGSDVLGLDDAMSRDHDWGCRLTILIDDADRDVIPYLNELLNRALPEQYQGLPVRFPTTWDATVSHKVEVATVGGFAFSRLGIDPLLGMSVIAWLTLTGQSVLEVTAGPVFADTTTELAIVRDLLRWYPPELERYVLAAAWQRVIQRFPFVGRTAQRGQEFQSQLACAGLVNDLMRIAFLLHRRWAPYPKWFETMFHTLPVAAELMACFSTGGTADWRGREQGLCAAAECLLRVQRKQGFPTPSVGVRSFFNRPYRTVNSEVPSMLLHDLTEVEVIQLPFGVGSIEQWVDNTDVLMEPQRRAALGVVYQAWLAGR